MTGRRSCFSKAWGSDCLGCVGKSLILMRRNNFRNNLTGRMTKVQDVENRGYPMNRITEQDARETFQGLEADIVQMVLEAWADWLAFSHRATWRFRRSRANFVWEQIVERAHQRFVPGGRVTVVKRNESFLFFVDNRVAFRFKKSDGTGMTSNVPTQEQLAFLDPQQDLPGLEDIAVVAVVYTLNPLETAIADVAVVAHNAGSVDWMFSLRGDAEVQPMPAAPVLAPEDAKSKSLVTPKGGERKSKVDADGDA